RSFIVMLKAMVAESLVAAIVLLVFFALDVPEDYFYAISFGGALVLFWLASQLWGIAKISTKNGKIFSFPKLLLLTILNGAFWIFWITICVPRAFELNQTITGGHVLFLGLFEVGWLTSTAVVAFIFSRFRPLLLKKRLVSVVFKTFALLLVFFGLKAVWVSTVWFFVGE
ncbi:hypothetical protein COT83_02695, partial [Candidatus Peregrinibacteria bacterium CG10_big_fil_rev_8_21_14_0_10_44_7]